MGLADEDRQIPIVPGNPGFQDIRKLSGVARENAETAVHRLAADLERVGDVGEIKCSSRPCALPAIRAKE